MLDNEQELTRAVERLDIDADPRPEHRAELRRRVLAAFEQAVPGQEPPAGPAWAFRLRRCIVNPTFARAAAAIGVVAFWPGPDGGVALAEVCERIGKVRTACFNMTWYRDGKVEYSGRAYWREPGLLRWEMPGVINIYDWAGGKILILITKARTAHSAQVSDLENPYHRDWIRDLKKMIGSDSAEQAGVKEVSGRKAKGWRFKEEGWVCTVWADARSGELLAAELGSGNFRMVMSEFVLDKALDKSLFDLTPPAEYTFRTQTTMKATDPSEKDAVVLLRVWAMGNNDTFPDDLDVRKWPEAAAKADWKRLGIKSQKDYQQVSDAIGRGFWFLHSPYESTYAGKGVRLGDETRPVFWYRLKESDENYRVIFGDLSAREVPPGKLPKATTQPAATRPAQ